MNAIVPNLYSQLIREAVKRGYKVDLNTGDVLTPDGIKLATRTDKDGDLRVRLRDKKTKKRHYVRAARFVGYIAFGELALDHRVGVAHKDGNRSNLSASNLTLIRRTSEPGIIEPIVSTEIMNRGELTPAQEKKLKDFNAHDLIHREDMERQRNDPLLRAVATKFVIDLGSDFLRGAAFELATRRHSTRPTERQIDIEADKLVWALVEFLTECKWNQGPTEESMIKAYQFSAFHAADWFDTDVSLMGDPYAKITALDRGGGE